MAGGNALPAVQAIAEDAWRAGAARAGLLNPVADELDKQTGSWTAYAKALDKSSISGLEILAARHVGHSAFMAGSMDGLKAHGITHFNFVSDFKLRNQLPVEDQSPSGDRSDAATGPCDYCASTEEASPHEVGGDTSYPPLHHDCECDVEPDGTTFRALAGKPIDKATADVVPAAKDLPATAAKAGGKPGSLQFWGQDETGRGAGSVKMTADQVRAVNSYQGDAYHAINDALRAGEDPSGLVNAFDGKTQLEASDVMSHMDAAIAAQPATAEDTTVYRTLNFDHAPAGEEETQRAAYLDSMRGATTVQDGGYVSTSINANAVFQGGDFPVSVEINVPAGTTNVMDVVGAHPVIQDAPYLQQHEVIFGRGTSFNVDSVEDKVQKRPGQPDRTITVVKMTVAAAS